MRTSSVDPDLKRKLSVLVKRDPKLYLACKRKMNEIAGSQDIHHYKNLRAPLSEYKRVHVLRPFVLVFRYDAEGDEVEFIDLDHHDTIYAR